MCKVISVSNQKGGVAKTVTSVNIGIGLAREGKNVLLIDADPQGSLTISLGYEHPDKMDVSLATIMMKLVNEEPVTTDEGILHHEEGVDLLPGNIELSGLEITMNGVMSRETILKQYIEIMRDKYDYIICDCMPSLGLLTINAFACADSVLIPVSAGYLSVRGLEQLLKTIGRVKRQLNPNLEIEGILLTMVDSRTNYARDIVCHVHEAYSSAVRVFNTHIPMSVRAAEISAEGISLYQYDPKGKAATAYKELVDEIIREEKSENE